jgi:preprotein translocase subunit SecF
LDDEEGQIGEQSVSDGLETIQKRELDRALGAAFGAEGYVELEFNNTSPSQAADLSTQMIWIVAAALVLILIYITIRFRWQYALGAIAAIAHDVLFLLGFLMVTQVEFSSATVAALLTIIGYSLNDTIVIFDRIRENRTLNPDMVLLDVSDLSITQSLGRTVITSLTTFLAVSAILFLAFGSIQDFALALTVGILVGTYSSIFVASPVMTLFSPSKEAVKPQLSVS